MNAKQSNYISLTLCLDMLIHTHQNKTHSQHNFVVVVAWFMLLRKMFKLGLISTKYFSTGAFTIQGIDTFRDQHIYN